MKSASLYENILDGADEASQEEIIEYLKEELPYTWSDEYKNNCTQPGDICIVKVGSFEYIFDDRTAFQVSKNNISEKLHSRIVAAFGISERRDQQRDDYRLRGWLGKTNTYFGIKWDKGHFIAHTIGGAVDQAELNVFKQRRDLNRGWSEEGKLYRKMEKYCYNHPGTFCFHRPVYQDESAYPVLCEYGILTVEKKLWIEQFNNCL